MKRNFSLTRVRILFIFVGVMLIINIFYNVPLGVIASFSMNNPVGKDRWLKGSDGKYRRLVDETNLNFEDMSNGDYTISHQPSPEPLGQLYSYYPSSTIPLPSQIVDIDSSNKGLQINFKVNGPTNLMYRTENFHSDYTYEVRFKATMTGGNWGTLYLKNKNGNLINTIEGNKAEYKFTKSSSGDMAQFNIINPQHLYIDIKLGAPKGLLIDYIQLVAVKDFNPNARPEAAKYNDMINQKGIGAFENDTWGGHGTVVTTK